MILLSPDRSKAITVTKYLGRQVTATWDHLRSEWVVVAYKGSEPFLIGYTKGPLYLADPDFEVCLPARHLAIHSELKRKPHAWVHGTLTDRDKLEGARLTEATYQLMAHRTFVEIPSGEPLFYADHARLTSEGRPVIWASFLDDPDATA